ncbi:MAG: site-2 protease family protein [Planctomycetota bacterium]|jgi:regulator of sigma E protease
MFESENLNELPELNELSELNNEPVKPSEPTERSESSETVKPIEPAKPSEPVEASKPAKPSEPAEPSEPNKPSEPAEPKGGKGGTFYWRLMWLIGCIAVALVIIVMNFGVFANILLAVVGLGLMVLVHEFGHFIVAKLSDIHVEAFSVGFPPILAGIRRTEEGYKVRILPDIFPSEKKGEEIEKEGSDELDEGQLHFTFGEKGRSGETEYRLGLIPFGGFVKMLGQEDIGKIKTSDDPRSYVNKPVFKRAAVISAGVCFNIISAIIIFMLVFLIGIERQPAVIGGVFAGSPAWEAGFEAGDEIIEVDGKNENLEFSDVGMAAALSGADEAVEMKVKRNDGSVEIISLVALKDAGMLSNMKAFGFLPVRTSIVSDVAEREKLYAETGLEPGDKITKGKGWTVKQSRRCFLSNLGRH